MTFCNIGVMCWGKLHSVFPVEVYLTAYQALTWNSHLRDGETILIHAVS